MFSTQCRNRANAHTKTTLFSQVRDEILSRLRLLLKPDFFNTGSITKHGVFKGIFNVLGSFIPYPASIKKDSSSSAVVCLCSFVKALRLVGPELLPGKLFDEIGFNIIEDELFPHLVITRLCYPVSKLKTPDYLFKYQGLTIDVKNIYRYLDKLKIQQKQIVQQISCAHTLKVLNNGLNLVFYDVTTLYFEAEQEDELRETGFSKDGKQII